MSTLARLKTEVCVIGGGPAGSTLARRLALSGHEVLLVERDAFPRSHIGESLAPGIFPLLHFLGVRERIDSAGFLCPETAFVRWAGKSAEMNDRTGHGGLQVDRGRFDSILLEAASDAGVKVIQPARALPPIHEGERRWRIPVRSGPERGRIECKFLVDASGRRSVQGGTTTRTGIPTFALYGYWQDVPWSGVESRVEAGLEEWYWGAPLPDGTCNAAVFFDPKRCALARETGLEAWYRSLLNSSTLLRDCLQGRLVSRVFGCDATSYFVTPTVGEDFIKAGEASFALDPLSSQGVQQAMVSGLQASIVVHTLLTRPEYTDAAIAFYCDRQQEAIEVDQNAGAHFYRERVTVAPNVFWQKRAGQATDISLENDKQRQEPLPSSSCRVRLSTMASLVQAPAICGDIVAPVPALLHPVLDRPVAYLGGVPVALLVKLLSQQATAGKLVELWGAYVSVEQARHFFSWMWSCGIIVPA